MCLMRCFVYGAVYASQWAHSSLLLCCIAYIAQGNRERESTGADSGAGKERGDRETALIELFRSMDIAAARHRRPSLTVAHQVNFEAPCFPSSIGSLNALRLYAGSSQWRIYVGGDMKPVSGISDILCVWVCRYVSLQFPSL